MTVGKEEREQLHQILDALINARNSLEGFDPMALKTPAEFQSRWSKPRRDLFRNGSVFLRKIIGPRLHEAELGLLFETELVEDAVGADMAATLANSFRSFLPLFMKSGRYEGLGEKESIEFIIDDLMGVYWGDEPRFFSLWARRQGLHKRPFRLAHLRLSALMWDKYLATVGMSAMDRHQIISTAYRTDWEAIRKWANSINDQFDLQAYPPRNADDAIEEFSADREKVMLAIQRDGDAYWAERNTAQSGKNR